MLAFIRSAVYIWFKAVWVISKPLSLLSHCFLLLFVHNLLPQSTIGKTYRKPASSLGIADNIHWAYQESSIQILDSRFCPLCSWDWEVCKYLLLREKRYRSMLVYFISVPYLGYILWGVWYHYTRKSFTSCSKSANKLSSHCLSQVVNNFGTNL
jgi:hypothetical protein